MLYKYNYKGEPEPVPKKESLCNTVNKYFQFTLLYNDFIVNIYTIGLGTNFYNILVPLHINTVIT